MAVFDFRTEAAKLTQGELVKGVVDMFIHERFATLVGKIPFVSTDNGEKEWVLEAEMSSDTSVFNPYGTSVGQGNGIKYRYSINSGQLAINADTPDYDQAANASINDPRTQYRIDASKKMAYDWETQLCNGMNLGPNLPGLEYYFAMYTGFAQPSANASPVPLLNDGEPLFPLRKLFLSGGDDNYEGTGDFSGGASKGALTLEAVRDLTSRATGMGFDALITTRKANLWIKHLYQVESGGSMPTIYRDEDFGLDVWAFDGVPIMELDHTREGMGSYGIGASIGGSAANGFGLSVTSTSGTDEATVANPGADADADFIGFSDRMVGLNITLAPGTADEEVQTIVAVNGPRTIDITTPDTAHTDVDFVVERQDDIIYGVKFSEYDGMCVGYHPFGDLNNSITTVDDDVTAMLGFKAYEHGPLEEGRKHRDKFDWYGMPLVMKPYGIARLTGFTEPATYNA